MKIIIFPKQNEITMGEIRVGRKQPIKILKTISPHTNVVDTLNQMFLVAHDEGLLPKIEIEEK